MIDLGDTLKVVVLYHDKKTPGVVKSKDGSLYVLDLIEPQDFKV